MGEKWITVNNIKVLIWLFKTIKILNVLYKRQQNVFYKGQINKIKSLVVIQDFLFLCAPARTRTWNDGSEDRCDIHFTTSASAF